MFLSQFFPNEERRRQWVYNSGILSWKRLCSLVILKIQREGRNIRIYRGLCDLQKHIQYYISLCLEDIQYKYKHFYLQKISYVYQWWGSGLVEKDKETASSSVMPSYRWGGRGPERTTEPARDRTWTNVVGLLSLGIYPLPFSLRIWGFFSPSPHVCCLCIVDILYSQERNLEHLVHA